MMSYDRRNVPHANGVDVKVDLIIQVLFAFEVSLFMFKGFRQCRAYRRIRPASPVTFYSVRFGATPDWPSTTLPGLLKRIGTDLSLAEKFDKSNIMAKEFILYILLFHECEVYLRKF